jgi:hypothetical protein
MKPWLKEPWKVSHLTQTEKESRPAAVVPGTEATGSKDAPDDDVDSGGDIKAVKKKKTPAKTLVGVL